jgi:hypothetical protein
LIGVVAAFDDLATLNEGDMNRLGWQRIPGWVAGDGEVTG